MKNLLLPLAAGLLLTSCAAVRVTDTQTAAVVTKRPSAIYIRPFSVDSAEFVGDHAGGRGERPIRQSLAPAEFGQCLKEELEKLAPARVLEDDEVATEGWLVTGTIDRVSGGSKFWRGFFPGGHPVGRSQVAIHVKIIDLDARNVAVEEKDSSTLRRRGRVIYEFDVAGGSRWTGKLGSEKAAALGHSATFDYRNAADRIRYAIEPDPHRYGARLTTTIR